MKGRKADVAGELADVGRGGWGGLAATKGKTEEGKRKRRGGLDGVSFVSSYGVFDPYLPQRLEWWGTENRRTEKGAKKNRRTVTNAKNTSNKCE